MGARRPGSTVPPQGGKGGVRPTQPGFPQQPQTPYTPIGTQPQVPAQGGKGGKGIDFGPNVFPGPQPQVLPPQGGFPQQPQSPGYIAQKYAEMERMRAGQPQQPGQVPAQGGKTPFTPEQQAAFGPYINTRPMPQVSPPQGGFPQQPGQVPAQGGKAQTGQVPDDMRPFISNLPQVSPPQGGFPQQSAIPGLQDALRGAFLNVAPGSPTGYPTQPAPVMPAQPQVQQRLSDMPQIQAAYGSQPQVMPRQPAPKPAPQGLAQMQQFLQQQQMLKGRR